jgi:hypothetical protein
MTVKEMQLWLGTGLREKNQENRSVRKERPRTAKQTIFLQCQGRTGAQRNVNRVTITSDFDVGQPAQAQDSLAFFSGEVPHRTPCDTAKHKCYDAKHP